MCIRDAAGDYVLARTTWFTPLCAVEIGEALGLGEATSRWIQNWLLMLLTIMSTVILILVLLLCIVDNYLTLIFTTVR